jgi:hypothetical protein
VIDLRTLTFEQIPAAFGWLLIVWGVSKLVLGSLPAEELRKRIAAYGQANSADLRLAQWELASGYRWHPALAHGDEMAPKVVLTQDELAERKALLQATQRQFWWKKPMLYFLGCDFCKAAWTALVLWLISGRGDGLIVNTAGFAIAVTALSHIPAASRPSLSGERAQPTAGGCKG